MDETGKVRPPFILDEERRLHLRLQLDAFYFHLYGLTREEADYILETFPIVKRHDIEQYGRLSHEGPDPPPTTTRTRRAIWMCG